MLQLSVLTSINKLEAQLLDESSIPLRMLKHWVDEHSLTRTVVSQQVRVGTAHCVE